MRPQSQLLPALSGSSPTSQKEPQIPPWFLLFIKYQLWGDPLLSHIKTSASTFFEANLRWKHLDSEKLIERAVNTTSKPFSKKAQHLWPANQHQLCSKLNTLTYLQIPQTVPFGSLCLAKLMPQGQMKVTSSKLPIIPSIFHTNNLGSSASTRVQLHSARYIKTQYQLKFSKYRTTKHRGCHYEVGES